MLTRLYTYAIIKITKKIQKVRTFNMRRTISIILSVILCVSALALFGCAKKEPLKLGLGIHSYYENVTNADGDATGKGEVISTFAAVLLDKDGKIVACQIDTSENAAEFTSDGKFVSKTEFKTKYELGEDYGMKKAGAAKEWFEQADAFETSAVGKTIGEVKAMIVDGKINKDVVDAGCTINVSDFVLALEKAVANAVDSEATEDATLKLGVVTEQSGKDATEDAPGTNELATYVSACATDKDGKVVATVSDCIEVSFSFDNKGVCSDDKNAKITSKKEAGASYGMAEHGKNFDRNGDGIVKEWFEQAAAFDSACIGKTSAEIGGLAKADGYGTDALQSAGCTIAVSGMVKATVKASAIG